MNIASCIDHTLLKPDSSLAAIEKLCLEAVEFGFAAVCVPPPFVNRVHTLLAPTHIKTATVIGFPFGYSATEAKIAETVLAIIDGADELDIVINLIALKMGDWAFLEKEVRMVTEIAHNKGKRIKIIVESGLLTQEEIIHCCSIFAPLGIDFMKTSTGYAEKGASVEAVQLMRNHLPSTVQIKASGGIRDYTFAKALLEAGATRLGCSAGPTIVKGDPAFITGNY